MSEEEIPQESDLEDKTSEEFLHHRENSYVLFKKKSAEHINEFLVGSLLFVEVYEAEWYYWELMAWSVKCIFAPPHGRSEPFRGMTLHSLTTGISRPTMLNLRVVLSMGRYWWRNTASDDLPPIFVPLNI